MKGGKAMQSAYLMLPTGAPGLAIGCSPGAQAHLHGQHAMKTSLQRTQAAHDMKSPEYATEVCGAPESG